MRNLSLVTYVVFLLVILLPVSSIAVDNSENDVPNQPLSPKLHKGQRDSHPSDAGTLKPAGFGSGSQILKSDRPPFSLRVPIIPDEASLDINSKTAEKVAYKKLTSRLGGGDIGLLSIVPLVDVYNEVVGFDIDFALPQYAYASYREIARQWQEHCMEGKEISSPPGKEGEGIIRNDGISNVRNELMYGSVTVSATFDSPPIRAFYDGLSNFYSGGWVAREIAIEVLNNSDPSLKMVYMLSPFGRAYVFSSGSRTIVVEGQEPYAWYEYDYFYKTSLKLRKERENEVKNLLNSRGLIYKKALEDTRKKNKQKLQDLLSSNFPSIQSVHLIPGYDWFQPLEWHYGCSPTAGAMVINYWDEYSWYCRLNYWFFREYDSIEGDMDCHVATAQEALADWMNTDPNGNTYVWDIYPGMRDYANAEGYCFTSSDWSGWWLNWCWDEIRDEIDAGRPFVWSLTFFPNASGSHSVTAVGYDDDGNVGCHSTWWYNGDEIIWVNHEGGILDFSWGGSLQPGCSVRFDAKIINPDGYQIFGQCGYSGTYYGGDLMDIRWENYGYSGHHVNIYYSTDGGENWDGIATTDDDESYEWRIPCEINSDECRIVIQQWSNSGFVSSDGSYGDFKIIPGSGPTQSPTLYQPGNGTTVCQSNVQFSWSSVPNAEEYDLWLDGEIVWSGPETSHPHDVPDLGNHSWKVRGKNYCGDGPWSPPWSFTREDPVTQSPNLLQPLDGAILCNSYVYFEWTPVNNAEEYDLWLDGSIIWSGRETSHSEHVSEGGHIWKVCGKNDCGDGPWSPMWSFTVEGAVTQSPNLLEPPNGDTLCDSYVEFRWSSVNNAEEYHLWLDGDTVWSGPETSHGRDLTAGDYTWKVRGRNYCGNGPWSSEWSFMRVDPITTAPSNCQATDSLCYVVTITWEWNGTGQEGFRIFRNSSKIGEEDSSARSYDDSTAVQGETYSYSVLAFNYCGDGTESNSDSGSVRDLPDSAVLVRPENGAQILGLTISFVWEWPPFFDSCMFVISKRSDLDSAVVDSAFQERVDSLELELPEANVYYWAVFTLSCDDSASSDTFSVDVLPTGIESSALQIPTEFFLDQCYPNPFNARTRILYGLPRNSRVLLEIYDLAGRWVQTLAYEHQTAGYKAVVWDGRNERGQTVASGIYFYRLTTGHFTETKRMTLLR